MLVEKQCTACRVAFDWFVLIRVVAFDVLVIDRLPFRFCAFASTNLCRTIVRLSLATQACTLLPLLARVRIRAAFRFLSFITTSGFPPIVSVLVVTVRGLGVGVVGVDRWFDSIRFINRCLTLSAAGLLDWAPL